MHYGTCEGCGRTYHAPVTRCTFCDTRLAEHHPETATVVAVTEVTVPSLGHEEVPYWCSLVEDDAGVRFIVKSDVARTVGERVPLIPAAAEEVAIVGLVGTGVMGSSLVEMLLARGHEVVWVGRSAESLERAHDKVFVRLGRTMDAAQLDDAHSRLTATTALDALSRCEVVIEAIVEDLEAKLDILPRIEANLAPGAVLATNTSAMPVDILARSLSHPERFGVLHFFNPAPRMRLVEIAGCPQTAEEVMATFERFVLSLGKQPVTVSARPAFVVNRTLMPLINEAVRSLEEGAADAVHIDEAIRLGLNHPMGPLSLADLIGIDVVVEIMQTIVRETGDRSYEPRPMLVKLLAEGALGRKSGRGFFIYG